MSKRATVGLVIIVFSLILATAILVGRHSEPVAHGRRLTDWVEQLGVAGTDQAQARSAITALGTEGTRFLLADVAEGDDPVQRRAYRSMWSSFPKRVQGHLPRPRSHGLAWLNKVAIALSLPDPPAVSELTGALTNQNPEVQLVAARAVGLLGPKADAAIPTLTGLLESAQPGLQFEAALALQRMGPARAHAVPALCKLVGSAESATDLRVQEVAISTLGLFGPGAQAAVPELRELLNSSNPGLRDNAALALWRVAQDKSVIPLLMNELAQTRDYQTCVGIIKAFGEIGPAAKEAIPVMLEKVNQRNAPQDRYALRSLRDIARRAISKIDPDVAQEMITGRPAGLDLRSGILSDGPEAKKLGIKPSTDP